jgi:hypothetical protein
VRQRGLIIGKKWLLMSRWKNLTGAQRGELSRLFQLNRRVFKGYLLKESLERLWEYRYEGAMLNYLQKWMDQLKWQRLTPFEKLADMLLKHLEGILNYCRTKVRFGVLEAVNGNIRMLINRGRGYKKLRYPLLKAKRMAVTNVEFVAVYTVKKLGLDLPPGASASGNYMLAGDGDNSSGETVYTLTGSGSGTLSSCQLINSNSAGGNWTASGTMTVTVSPAIVPGSVGVALGSYSAALRSPPAASLCQSETRTGRCSRVLSPTEMPR